jgi:hypothetical protein
MFAVKEFNAGDIIVHEAHAVVFDATSGPPEDCTMDEYRKLDYTTRARFDDLDYLTNCPEPTSLMKAKHKIIRLDCVAGWIVGIFNNNSYQDNNHKRRYVAIEASRINHSCMPNAAYIFYYRDMIVIRALLSVSKGEEVFVSYINPTKPQKDSAKGLLRY